MKKILSKVFKAPVVFSFGVIAAFALFTFFQPQKPAVGVAEANSAKAVEEPQTTEPQAEVGIVSEQESVFLATGSDSSAFRCRKEGSVIPYSDTLRTDAPWSTIDMPLYTINSNSYDPSEATANRNFVDLNGDGLLDFLYSRSFVTQNSSGYTTTINECVMLNNGIGWDPVFMCKGTITPQSSHFEGDCAQQ